MITFVYSSSISLLCIAQNISHGKPNATQKEIEAAAAQAGAHEFISQLPEVCVLFLSPSPSEPNYFLFLPTRATAP